MLYSHTDTVHVICLNCGGRFAKLALTARTYRDVPCVSVNIWLPLQTILIITREGNIITKCFLCRDSQGGCLSSYVRRVCSEVHLFLLVGEWRATECEFRLISIKSGVMTPSKSACFSMILGHWVEFRMCCLYYLEKAIFSECYTGCISINVLYFCEHF